jgi:phosphatidylglycerophosphate synthase
MILHLNFVLPIVHALRALAGALARALDQTSELGTVLDIVGDRIVEFLVFVGLWAYAPLMRGGYVLFMLGASYICVTSFLVVSMFSENKSHKTFHYSPGLIERAEAFIFFFLMILFPSFFGLLAFAFGALVFYTAVVRVYGFYTQTVA